jgi:hypothetical protein
MRHSLIRQLRIASLSLWLVACSEPPPEFCFVPAENYKISVQIEVPQEAVVGEWVPLRARRWSGPWKRVKCAEVLPDTTWFAKPPPASEEEVADNLTWLTEPAGVARFDIPTAPLTHERKAMFSQPGTFRIWGSNAYPTRAESNVATVTVRPKG